MPEERPRVSRRVPGSPSSPGCWSLQKEEGGEAASPRMGPPRRLPARHLPAMSSLSLANAHDLISSPMALARGGGTALPTCDRRRVERPAPAPPRRRRGDAAGEGFAAGADLSVLVEDVPKEAVSIGEALGAGALPHAHHPVLLRVQHPTLRQQTKKTNGQDRGGHWVTPAPSQRRGALRGVWAAGRGRFSFHSALPWGGPIWSPGSSSGLPSSRKMRSYWREPSGAL